MLIQVKVVVYVKGGDGDTGEGGGVCNRWRW